MRAVKQNRTKSGRAKGRLFTLAVVALLGTGALAGCVGEEADASAKTATIGVPGGWIGEEIRSYMVQKVMEDELGYEIEMVEDLGAGVIYTGLGTGDLDIFVGAWLPLQKEHLERQPEGSVDVYADNLPSEGLSLSLSVPKYLYDEGITSIADLDENRDMFDGTITGIEPGAGMMITAKERLENWDVYGLGDWTIQDSSTPAMLSAYDDAVKSREPIVVTMWKPHYAYAKWEGDEAMVELDDPGYEVDGETKYLYQDQTDVLHVQTLLTGGFAENHPEAAKFLKNFQIPIEDENQNMLKVNEGASAKEVAVQYIEEHPELVQQWLGE